MLCIIQALKRYISHQKYCCLETYIHPADQRTETKWFSPRDAGQTQAPSHPIEKEGWGGSKILHGTLPSRAWLPAGGERIRGPYVKSMH